MTYLPFSKEKEVPNRAPNPHSHCLPPPSGHNCFAHVPAEREFPSGWSPSFISIVGQKASPLLCLEFIHLCSFWAKEKPQFPMDVLGQQETQVCRSSDCHKNIWNEHLIQCFKSFKNTMENMIRLHNTWGLCWLGLYWSPQSNTW